MKEKEFVSAALKQYRRADDSLDVSLKSLEFLMHGFIDRICEKDNEPSHTSQYMAMFLHRILISNNKDDIKFWSAATDSDETLAVMFSDLKILEIAYSLHNLNEQDRRCRAVMVELNHVCLGECIRGASSYLKYTKQQLLLFSKESSYDKSKLENDFLAAKNSVIEVNKFCDQFYVSELKLR